MWATLDGQGAVTRTVQNLEHLSSESAWCP